jgi:predicted ribosome-associated RNA-binding protein Tma20
VAYTTQGGCMNYIVDQEQYSRLLTKDQYRIFTEYLDDNYEELYSNKVGYMVEKIEDKYKITLTDNTIISFEDIFK